MLCAGACAVTRSAAYLIVLRPCKRFDAVSERDGVPHDQNQSVVKESGKERKSRQVCAHAKLSGIAGNMTARMRDARAEAVQHSANASSRTQTPSQTLAAEVLPAVVQLNLLDDLVLVHHDEATTHVGDDHEDAVHQHDRGTAVE